MSSASAGVAKSGLRRGAQDPVAKAFVGSNPTSRTKLLMRCQEKLEAARRHCMRWLRKGAGIPSSVVCSIMGVATHSNENEVQFPHDATGRI